MLLASNVARTYATAGGSLSVLDRVSLQLDAGEAAVITGPSGSGKSTLLYILGALDPPSSGTVTLDGVNPYTLDERAAARFRNRHIGFVFQDHALLPQLSVIENVLVPTLVAREPEDFAGRARDLLSRVGLGNRLHHRPSQLSGGEKQRVAIARALVRQPSLVLCDEPTGNLDAESAGAVADLLFELHRAQRTILIAVTHSEELAARFPTKYRLAHGQLVRL